MRGLFPRVLEKVSRVVDPQRLRRLAKLKPKTLALMHGSTFVGDGGRALLDLSAAMREILGGGNSNVA